MTIENISSWLQGKIDYWEDIVEKYKQRPFSIDQQVIYDEGKEAGEAVGILYGFYEVRAFIKREEK
jgi:hypothetical protein